MIYFIRKPDGSAIKIGTTIRVGQRLQQLAAEHGDGLEVMAVLEGSFDEEKALHRRFAHLRTVGEWFEPGDDLLGFIVSDGKPWDGVTPVSVKIEPDALEAVKLAAAETGESISAYASRVLKRDAIADVEELSPLNAAKKLERVRAFKQPEEMPKSKARRNKEAGE